MPRGSAATVNLKDVSGVAAAFFAGVRIPATLILGSSLSALFIYTHLRTNKNKPCSSFSLWAIYGFNIVMLTSFILSLQAVLTSTTASTKMLRADYDPMAASGYELLRREFDFEFTTTRWSFLLSLILFIVGVSLRILLEFELIPNPNHDTTTGASSFWGVLCLTTSLLTYFLSYINSTLVCWDNLFDMTIEVLKMTMERLQTNPRPLQLVSVVSLVAGLGLFGKSIAFPTKDATATQSTTDESIKSKKE